MLAHAGGDDGVALGHLIQQPDGVLGLDDFLGVVERERVLLLPVPDLGVPVRVGPEIGFDPGFAGLLQELIEAAQRVFDVAEDRQSDDLVLVDLGVVDVDVDDRAVFGELADLAGDTVVEPHADGQEQIGFVNGVVGVNGAVHAQPLEGKRMRFRETPNAHERGGHGNPRALHKLQQFPGGFSGDDAAAAVDHRATRLADHADDLVEGHVVGVFDRVVAAERDFVGENRLGGGQLDVFRDVDEHRPGPPALGDVESFLYDPWDVVDVHHQVVVFDHLRRDAEHVGLLECAFPDHRLGHLAGDGHQRGRVQVGVRDTGDQVGGARAGRRHHHARLSRGPRVAFRGKHAALLMPGQVGADFFGAGERLVHVHRGAAGVGKNGVHSLPLQTGDEDVRATHGFTAFGGGGRRGLRFGGRWSAHT